MDDFDHKGCEAAYQEWAARLTYDPVPPENAWWAAWMHQQERITELEAENQRLKDFALTIWVSEGGTRNAFDAAIAEFMEGG